MLMQAMYPEADLRREPICLLTVGLYARLSTNTPQDIKIEVISNCCIVLWDGLCWTMSWRREFKAWKNKLAGVNSLTVVAITPTTMGAINSSKPCIIILYTLPVSELGLMLFLALILYLAILIFLPIVLLILSIIIQICT